jgi:hypothetical protein
MTIRCLILTSVLMLPVIAKAEDKVHILKGPDHLVPVNPYPGNWSVRYNDELHSRLNLDSSFLAQMVVKPSFSGEYAVRLLGSQDINPLDTSKKFYLTYAAASKNIWYSMPKNNNQKKQLKVSISFTKVEIFEPLAVRIQQLWKRMLYQTHYFETNGVVVDGVIYEFGIWHHYGEAHSPQERKSPWLFIELGESLITFCKAAPEERPNAAKEIENKAAQLEKYLNKHSSK